MNDEMTAAAGRERITKEPLELTPKGEAIHKALVDGTFDALELACVAYCAASHLERGYCDDPDLVLDAKGGKIFDADPPAPVTPCEHDDGYTSVDHLNELN